MENARSAALRALLRVELDKGYSNLVLDHALKSTPLNGSDRSLATALFYGVLERRITLDYYIGCFSKIPIKKMSPKTREILRMGVYQLLFLEKIPAPAAVNECVELAKKNGEMRSSGFINAVLRNLLRKLGELPQPDPAKEPLRYLSVKYSCPEWLISLWREAYGEPVTVRLLESLTEKPDVFIRVNNTLVTEEQLVERLSGENIRAERVGWPSGALRLKTPGEIGRSSCYGEGLFHVQDLSSQICCTMLNPQEGESVLDVCAAPGGKTFTLAELMNGRGKVTAFDKYEGKVKLIREGAERLHLSSVSASVRDAAEPGKDLEPADKVLCDVPCSGLGVLRRKPEIRYKLAPALDSLPDLQYLILCRTSELVKKGGTLFYSTCTLNPRENSGVARRFLSEHADFEPLALSLPEQEVRAIAEPENEWTLMPYANGTDGFFLAAFCRKKQGSG